MELRYRRNGKHWMPEYKSKKTGNWETFTEDFAEKHSEIKRLATALGSLEKSYPFYSNTKNLFFDTEMQVMAFLGGCQIYFADEVKSFEVFLDESTK